MAWTRPRLQLLIFHFRFLFFSPASETSFPRNVLGLGVSGVAFATSVAEICSALVIAALLRKRKLLSPKLRLPAMALVLEGKGEILMVVTSCFYGSGAYFSLSLDDASACWGIIISKLYKCNV